MNSLINFFRECAWKPTAGIQRPFVKYPARAESSGSYCTIRMGENQTRLSVVIPTIDADRGGYFVELIEQISRQSYPHFELIVVKGDSRQGRAINIAAALAKGDYLMTLDDDTALPDSGTFGRLVDTMETRPDIGIAGGSNVVPLNATPFVKRTMREIPRRSWLPVEQITDSDLAEHPCMIMRTHEFKAVGGENELIPRGLDPYLRERFRQIGKRVVVAPRVIYHHLPPASLLTLVRQFFRNGRNAAFVNRYFPQWVIETPSYHGDFQVRRSFAYRLIRFCLRLIEGLAKGMVIFCICELSYAVGFFKERILGRHTIIDN